MKIAGYETHPAADIFPLLEGAELDALAEDIRRNGLVHPVVVIGSKVLDGRNRLAACARIGIEARFTQYEGETPWSFVASVNLRRRDLTAGQKAAFSVEMLPEIEAENEARRRVAIGLSRKKLSANQRATVLAEGGQEHLDIVEAEIAMEADEMSANLRSSQKSSAVVAKLAGTSSRTIETAKRTKEHAAPEVWDAVKSGRLAVSAAADLSKLDHDKQRAVLARSSGKPGNVRALVKQVEKAAVAEKLNAEPPPMPAGPFRVIVSDPPWQYDKRAGDATHRGDLPYPSMSTDAICALDVGSLAHPDGCVLWLWTTNAFMRDAFRVLDAWGFEERTILTWAKNRIGLGDWLRGQTEHCILAARGKPTLTLTNQTTLLNGPVREHSRKPEEFYALVETLCAGSKVEMFCRTPREGWAKWGAETERFVAAE